ncbi:cupin domain-containing protein [Dryocola clanedunensis]|uniref:cupin domain-containing protein n=1 Tax=Cedecea sulfonylureivorans TaxID=3051154 RepID=UPI001925E930|nr:cupin domain-containing protein [Cedecea sulfonylureivorans]
MEYQKVKLNDAVTMQVISYSEQLMTAKFWFSGPGFAGTHHHDHEEVNIVVSGEFEATNGEQKYRVKAGETATISSGVEHDMKCVSGEAVMISVWTPARKDLLKLAGL